MTAAPSRHEVLMRSLGLFDDDNAAVYFELPSDIGLTGDLRVELILITGNDPIGDRVPLN